MDYLPCADNTERLAVFIGDGGWKYFYDTVDGKSHSTGGNICSNSSDARDGMAKAIAESLVDILCTDNRHLVVLGARYGFYIFSVLVQRFFRKIVLYLLPIVFLAISLEIAVERIPNSYTYKRQYMEQHSDAICTLVLGHSCAYDGIDAEVWSKTFNLANSSQCFEDDYRLLEKYMPLMDSLERVVLPLSYSSLQMVSSSNRRVYYTIYMNLYPRWPLSKYSMECFNLELMIKKVAKFILNEDMVQCDSLGQRIGHTLENRPREWQDTETLIRNDRFVGENAMPYVMENREWLRKMAMLCEQSGVVLWLVAMPMMEEYRKGMPLEQIMLMEQVVQDMAAQYDCVEVLDYQDWGTDMDFWNATHLNTDGAERLTRMLSVHCKNIQK